jgi:hypothetical protein
MKNVISLKVRILGSNLFLTREYIQRVTEISTFILTGNRTRQKEQLFYLPFCRKTMFNSKKNWRDFSTVITRGFFFVRIKLKFFTIIWLLGKLTTKTTR